MARHVVPDRRDRAESAAFRLLLAALRAPSRERGVRWGGRLGRVMSRVAPLRRRVALDNMAAAFPGLDDAARRGIYLRMMEILGTVLADFSRYGRRNPEPLSGTVTIGNREAVDRALQAGRGAVLLSAHFGNWEVLGAGMAQAGYPMTAIGGRQRNPLVEDLIARYRSRVGLPSLSVGESLRPLVQALARGSCVASLADQDGGRDGFFLDFLGRKASVQSGLFRLCARRGIPVVSGFCVREGDRWQGVLQEAIVPAPVREPAAVEAEARRLAAAYTARVEEAVRGHPDHWFWLHRRWKTRPPG